MITRVFSDSRIFTEKEKYRIKNYTERTCNTCTTPYYFLVVNESETSLAWKLSIKRSWGFFIKIVMFGCNSVICNNCCILLDVGKAWGPKRSLDPILECGMWTQSISNFVHLDDDVPTKSTILQRWQFQFCIIFRCRTTYWISPPVGLLWSAHFRLRQLWERFTVEKCEGSLTEISYCVCSLILFAMFTRGQVRVKNPSPRKRGPSFYHKFDNYRLKLSLKCQ